MKGVIRLTPIVPGEMHPVIFVDGKIREGFVGGECANGLGFPQWAHKIFSGDKVHWFRGDVNRSGERHSLCGRVSEVDSRIHLPGNFPHGKACEKALAVQRKYGGQL
ncbi:hypothetical protein [Burkholderia cepacia]|uniref:Uncharacterized protein n=1 Tax=Burkholderia cepacia TaxID=292 RepID=A0ABN5CUN9_BURCE|nr:hypothetical protein [Burkholderia cepacia]AIO22788.1 hypothetical protein DM41_2894 [Burkholderia cepacia ATCC 25416]ALK18444.1 hypothetical protein APZ15_11870 [Burkholderia cepacia ATCC 25416]ASE96084.1 hypothetical protein CEQ23_22440 [Burkholderia cepacia]ATF78915.1 hypothetical protein CO711_16825 [Burkholderia cepacia]MCA8466953.1 hypothetical protein [Burkholderia cepacia]